MSFFFLKNEKCNLKKIIILKLSVTPSIKIILLGRFILFLCGSLQSKQEEITSLHNTFRSYQKYQPLDQGMLLCIIEITINLCLLCSAMRKTYLMYQKTSKRFFCDKFLEMIDKNNVSLQICVIHLNFGLKSRK